MGYSNLDICRLNWIKSDRWPNHQISNNRISLADLFSGCGGMSLGAIEAIASNGFSPSIKLAIDLYADAISIYKNNFSPFLAEEGKIIQGNIGELLQGDIGSKLTISELNSLSNYREVDLVVAGPPCQGHSNLNNYTRREDPRNQLYLKVVRFAEIFQPKVIIIENVASVLNDKGNVVGIATKRLKELGYFVNEMPFLINVSEYGIPQLRKRHIHLASKSKEILDIDLSIYKGKSSVWDYISDLEEEPSLKDGIFRTPSTPNKTNFERIKYLFDKNIFDLPNELRPKCHQKAHSYTSCYGRINKSKPSNTITSGFGSMGQGRYVHPTKMRTITPHEAARIQGFPDFFSFESAKNRSLLQTIIANAVPPKVIGMIVDQCIKKGILN